jgi:hypothetical protein
VNRPFACVAALALAVSAAAHAQTIRVSCPEFFTDPHQRVTCVEALFSQNNYHFTLASLPAGNGFAPGIVLTHRFTGFIGNPPRGNQVDVSLTGAVSTNGSTFEGGNLIWTLPFGSQDTSTSPNALESADQKSWHNTAFTVQAAHQAVHAVNYYGDGPLSPDHRFVYAEDDIWGKAAARIPLAKSVVFTAETGLRATALPLSGNPEAIEKDLPVTTLPGYVQQPLFAVSQVGVETRAFKHVGGFLPDERPNDPLLLFFSDWEFENNASSRWLHSTDGSAFSFRQFRFDGNEHAFVKARVRRTFTPSQHPLLYYTLCQGQSHKRTERCNIMLLNVKSRLVLSDMPSGNQIPFYLEPTLGGSDFDNNVSLRAWDNYRFRARDSALLQADINALVWDPFGIYVFYDAGTVGNQPGDLALNRFRQDAGVGGTARIQGNIVAETYLAWGRGHGPRWSFNFSKVF